MLDELNCIDLHKSYKNNVIHNIMLDCMWLWKENKCYKFAFLLSSEGVNWLVSFDLLASESWPLTLLSLSSGSSSSSGSGRLSLHTPLPFSLPPRQEHNLLIMNWMMILIIITSYTQGQGDQSRKTDKMLEWVCLVLYKLIGRKASPPSPTNTLCNGLSLSLSLSLRYAKIGEIK